MVVERIRLHRIVVPMRTPFTASHGTELYKHATIVEAVADGLTGWGECAALELPTYTDEFADGAFETLSTTLAPAALHTDAWTNTIDGHPMAKAGLELALLDLELRGQGTALARYLEGLVGTPAAQSVPAGLSIGITRDIDRLCDIVDQAVAEGYQRVRLKIEPGFDVDPLTRIRSRFPALPLQVDANGAYSRDRPDHVAALSALEPLGLLMIEQPLAAGNLADHATLAERLSIPLCLDEPIVTPSAAAQALSMRACSIINIKVARLGGIAPTLATLGICRSTGSGAWCGGMLDTGIGRAVNVAIAAQHGFTSPGDIAATDRYFERDIITTRFVVARGKAGTDGVHGTVAVPQGPGIGVEIDRDALRSFTIATRDVYRE